MAENMAPNVRYYLQDDFEKEIEQIAGASEILDMKVYPELVYASTLRPGDSFSHYSLPLYVAVRLFKPEIVIETGTQNGGSAQAILCGLRDNQYGKLYSIDSGPASNDRSHFLTVGQPGERITPELKDRWELTLGFTQDKLPNLLERLGRVDLFFHDSDHSKPVVEFEFKEILRYCAKGSVVGLHDHLGQWDWRTILQGFKQLCGADRPEVHRKDGAYHNVIRMWEKM